MFACAALLVACSGSGAPSGAVGGAAGGGPVGGNDAGPLGGGSAAAQPMDTGFSGPKKDVDSLHYFIRDARARVLCQAGEEKVKVRFQGFLMTESPSGESYSMVGLLMVKDLSAGKYQVTQASMDMAQHGFVDTTLKVQTGINVAFFHVQSHDGPLDTLLPVNQDSFSLLFSAEPKPQLIVEQSPNAGNPCMEAVKQYEFSEQNGD